MTAFRIAFRVDASGTIGTGHVMRCLTLANDLRAVGATIRFICRAHTGHLADRIRAAGYETVLLPLDNLQITMPAASPSYRAWLGAEWEDDARETMEAIRNFEPVWLIADHYAIDAHWESRVKSGSGVKIMAIDGQADRKHQCDLLLDPTYSPEGNDRWKALLPASCRLLAGPRFAPLRPEFAVARSIAPRRSGFIKHIFIAFGGIDAPNATSLALAAIAGLSRHITVDVVAGATNPHLARLSEQCRQSGFVTLHVEPPDIAQLMNQSDLAISAGGTMLLEQCFLGLPSLVLSIADNQVRAAQALHELGAVRYMGNLGEHQPAVAISEIQKNMEILFGDHEALLRMSTVAGALMSSPKESISQILQELTQ